MELSEFKERLASGTITRREIHKVLASVGVMTVTTQMVARPARAASTIDVYTWSGYDAPELRGSYEAAYGAAPKFVLFADNDEAVEKVRAGYTPTLAQPTSYMIGKWHDLGLLKPLDTSRLSNYPNVFKQLKDLHVFNYDGQVWGTALAWGNSSVLFRKDLAPEYVGADSWTILWDNKYAGRLAQRDSMDAAFLEAGLILGIKNLFNMSDDELQRCRQLLAQQRPLLRYYWSSQSDVEQAVASGEVVATYAWNDAYANLLKQGVDVGYMIPKEGILTWVDSTVILKDGPGNEKEAYDYIDATISPETGKFMIESYGYGAANTRSFAMADQSLLKGLGIENPDKVMALGVFFDEWNPQVRDRANGMFEEVKAGF